MNRKAILILSDVTWFVVFIVAAALLFFFLYRPLNANVAYGLDTSSSYDADAQTSAYALAQLPVMGTPSGNRFAASALVDAFAAYAKDAEDTEAKEAIDTTLKLVLSEAAVAERLLARNPKDTSGPVEYAVAYSTDGRIRQENCIEVRAQSTRSLCERWQNAWTNGRHSPQQHADPSGIYVPRLPDLGNSWHGVGFVHLPTEPVTTVFVTVAYEVHDG